jgi:hypothetical protein
MGAPTEISRRHMLAMSAAGGLAGATWSGARAQAPGAKRIEQFDPALEKIISTTEPIKDIAFGFGRPLGSAEGPVWIREGLAPLSHELGIHICGGRGKHSRETPQELVSIGDRVGIDGAALAKASRLVAKVDSAAVQDGFDLYLHGFIVTDDGKWTVVQQGMNGGRKQARRYHWLSERLTSFVDDPHTAIEGAGQGEIINLADRRAEPSRLAQIDILATLGPDKIAREFSVLETGGKPSPRQPSRSRFCLTL